MKKIFFLWTCLMVALSSNAQTLYQEKDIHLDTVQNKTLDSSNQPINGIVKVFFENGKI